MVVLANATQDQMIESWRLNSTEWGDDLTPEQHIGREQAQYATYADGKKSQTNWILLEDEKIQDILSACESLLRPAVVSHVVDGKRTVTHGNGYGIASVFCRASYRGRGYATKMMAMVSERLRQDDFLGGALWSDIGPVFYSKFGWKSYSSLYCSFTVSPSQADDTELVGEWITDKNLQAVCEGDCNQIIEEIQNSISTKTIWSFLPTYDVMRWHHARMAYVYSLRRQKSYGNGHSEVTDLGYSLSESAWCTWTLQFQTKSPTLYILRLRYTNSQELSKLLQGAAAACRKYGLPGITLWDPKRSDVEGLQLTGLSLDTKFEREDSLSALQINGDNEDIEWMHNEKFCWC